MESVENTEGKTERQYFPFFRSYYNSIDNLPESMQLPLYRAIALFSLDFAEPDFSTLQDGYFLQAVWEGILPNLKASITKYRNGKKGGAPKGNRNGPNGRKGNQPTTNQQPTENQANKKKEEEIEKEIESLVFPFQSPKFLETWKELCRQPKWRKKTPSALQKSLDKLAVFPEAFAVELMETAIANDTQGVVYPSTPEAFKKWEKEHPASTGAQPAATRRREMETTIKI